MVALVLYRHKFISDVFDDLGLALPDEKTPFVSKSAAAQAGQSLGSEPLKLLFGHSAQHWCSRAVARMSPSSGAVRNGRDYLAEP